VRACKFDARVFCCYCKRTLERHDAGTRLAATRDHVKATALGGRGIIVPCCVACNELKGAIHIGEWWWFIEHHPRWWKLFTSNLQVRQALVAERVRRAYAREPQITREPMLWPTGDGVGRYAGGNNHHS
jgi:hypothetical protein